MEEKSVQLETEPANLEEILRNVIAQMEQKIADRGVQLHLQIPLILPLLEVDLYRMEQAFSNLLANALRHGRSEGGEITISMTLQREEFLISFRDNGPGIPFQDQEHIFDRFYRVGGDRARLTGGTGLGLSIVKNVVQVHGGRLVLESKPGAGSTFSIFLPIKRTL
jgi:signal transduction histidine kinase